MVAAFKSIPNPMTPQNTQTPDKFSTAPFELSWDNMLAVEKKLAEQTLAYYQLTNICVSLEAENVALRKALEPFVALLQPHNDFDSRQKPKPDATAIFGINSATITLGDLRAAKAALTRRA